MMTIKKIILSVTLFSFSYSIALPQTYEEAATTTQVAENLKDEGQYDASYDKSLEALIQIDSATSDLFRQIMGIKIAEDKASADTAIASTRESGAATDVQFKPAFDNAIVLYNNAIVSNQAGVNNLTNFITASNNYNYALSTFTGVVGTVDTIKADYLTRERASTSKVIDDTRASYNSAVTSKAIVKGDANDTQINNALNQATAQLGDDAFQNAITQANNAKTTIDAAIATHNNLMNDARNVLAATQVKYNTTLADNTIVQGDTNDVLVTSIIAEASTAIEGNEANTAIDKSKEADVAIDSIITANAELKNANIILLENVTNTYNTFVSNNTIVKDTTDDISVSSEINEGETAFNENKQFIANEKLSLAQTNLNDIFNRYQEAQSNNIIMLEDLNTRYNKLINDGDLEKNSEEDTLISTNLSDAKTDMDENKHIPASEKLIVAQDAINKAELQVTRVTEDGENAQDGDVIIADAQAIEENATADVELIPPPAGDAIVVDNEQEEQVTEVDTEGKITTLPMYYTVMSRTPLTDAIWRISGMSFIYNDPLYWERIYLANRDVLRDPDNPHLIYPGQVLTIPSIRGELRSGTYIEGGNYITFQESLALMSNNIVIPVMDTNGTIVETNNTQVLEEQTNALANEEDLAP